MLKSFILLFSICCSLRGENYLPKFLLSWPTPNPAFAKGMGYSAFLQKTGPAKEFSSGSFGCVRNNGYKFHEGIDLYPVKRDGKGQAIDTIYAAMSGKVSYVNNVSSHSAYGRYLVIEHLGIQPAMYSLYGHLASINSRVKKGDTIKVAQPIGKMGNSASYSIPLSRSHLHFEIGLRLTDKFQSWYDRKSYKSPNRHGNFSGFNLVGFDPLPFFSKYQAQKFETPLQYLRMLTPEAKIRIKTKYIPDFAKRYPSLCRFLPDNNGNGWDVILGPYGLPVSLQQTNLCQKNDPLVTIISYDQQNDHRKCRRLISKENGKLVLTEQLKVYIELLFGIKVV